jgi:hypothetical protein
MILIITDKFLIGFNLSKEENNKRINSDKIDITEEEKGKTEKLEDSLLPPWFN